MYYMAKKDVSEAVCSVSEAADSFVTVVARSSAKFHSSLVFQGAKEIGTPPCFQMAEAENICNVQRLIGISNGPYNCVQSLLEPTSPHMVTTVTNTPEFLATAIMLYQVHLWTELKIYLLFIWMSKRSLFS